MCCILSVQQHFFSVFSLCCSFAPFSSRAPPHCLQRSIVLFSFRRPFVSQLKSASDFRRRRHVVLLLLFFDPMRPILSNVLRQELALVNIRKQHECLFCIVYYSLYFELTADVAKKKKSIRLEMGHKVARPCYVYITIKDEIVGKIY